MGSPGFLRVISHAHAYVYKNEMHSFTTSLINPHLLWSPVVLAPLLTRRHLSRTLLQVARGSCRADLTPIDGARAAKVLEPPRDARGVKLVATARERHQLVARLRETIAGSSCMSVASR